MTTWQIRNLIDSGLYWNNDDGWVIGRRAGTVFTEAERNAMILPIDGRWAISLAEHDKAILKNLKSALDDMGLVDEDKVENARDLIETMVKTLLNRLDDAAGNGEHLYYSVQMVEETSETTEVERAVEKFQCWRQNYPDRDVRLYEARAHRRRDLEGQK